MATRIYAVAPGGRVTDVIEDVGPTATSAIIAVVVDLTATLVTDGSVASGSRGVRKAEVLQALDTLKEAILADTWPPA